MENLVTRCRTLEDRIAELEESERRLCDYVKQAAGNESCLLPVNTVAMFSESEAHKLRLEVGELRARAERVEAKVTESERKGAMPTDDLLTSQEMEDHYRRHRGTQLLNVFVIQQVINLTYAVEYLLQNQGAMATQADVQALTDSINASHQELTDGLATLQAELNSLGQANPDIDLSGATAAVQSLEQTVSGVKDLAPESSAPSGPTGPVQAPFEPPLPPDQGGPQPPEDTTPPDTTDSTDGGDTTDTPPADDTPEVNPEA